MLVLTSCASKQKEEFELPLLYFPKFPDPASVIPLDEELQEVTDEQTEIKFVLLPWWYWQLIVWFKIEIDETKIFYQTFYNDYKKMADKHPP